MKSLLYISIFLLSAQSFAKQNISYNCIGHERFNSENFPKRVLYTVDYETWDKASQSYRKEFINMKSSAPINLKYFRKLANKFDCADLIELIPIKSEDSIYDSFIRLYSSCNPPTDYELTGLCNLTSSD